jgi:hypothetical protein
VEQKNIKRKKENPMGERAIFDYKARRNEEIMMKP